MKTFKNFVNEAEDTVTRDKSGKVVSWEHKGDWKKTDKKNPVGKIHHMSDVARRKTEKMTKEEIEQIEEMAISSTKNSTGQKVEWHSVGNDNHMIHVNGQPAHKGFLDRKKASEMYNKLKEEIEQIDENPVVAAIGATAGRALASSIGRKLGGSVAKSISNGVGKQAVKRVGAILRTPKGREVAGQVGSHVAKSFVNRMKKNKNVKEEVERVDEAKLVGILRHPEHGKAYIWHKGGEGGYNYEVEHTKTRKKETHAKSHEDVVADLKKRGYKMDEEVEQIDEVAAWQRSEGKNPEGGLNQKGIDSYRRENPGSKLSMAVTTKPSKLKKGSKAWNRRKSFCARMGGMKRKLTSSKTANDPDSRINKSLRKWNC